ncbi:hypothetical protein MPER_05011, partial [Moniliophthora perniciosa FA553]
DKYIYTFDPKALHHILIKDQYTFQEQPVFILLLFGNGLLSTLGEHHRKQRKGDAQPGLFDRSYARYACGIAFPERFRMVLKRQIEILSWMSRTALELVGQSGLGYSFDPLTDENCAHPYPKALKGLLSLLAVTFWSRT